MATKISLLALLLLVPLLSGCRPVTNETKPSTVSAIPTGVSIGNLAPDFHLGTFNGENITLISLRGKPVLLNFWATWCPPCKAEMPFLQQIYDSWSSKGLVVLEVDVGEKPGKIQDFMTANNITLTMPIAMDADTKVTTKSYLIGSIPATFFLDKDGIIRQKKLGNFTSISQIESELSKIIP